MRPLFSYKDLRSRKRKPRRDTRKRRQIPTGHLRLIEPPRSRLRRETDIAWKSSLEAVRKIAFMRLELLRGHSEGHELPCPWGRVVPCDSDCRCAGEGSVSVEFLREHYTKLASELAHFVAKK